MPRNIVVLFDNPDGRKVIRDVCEANNVIYAAFEEMVQFEVEQTGKKRRHGLWDYFDDILDRIQLNG